MSQLVRAKHPKIILGVVGALIAVPVLGITISLVGVNANTPQDVSMQEVSMQDVSMEENTQDTASVQHETVPTVAAGVAESQPAQSPLPDPLAPEPSASNTPESEMTAEPKKTAEAETATPTPTSEPKATATPAAPKIEKVTPPVVTEQVVNEPKTVKKATQVVGGWTAPVVNPGTVSLRAPQISSGQRVTLTVACSPSVNCVINGDQLTITEGTQVTVTYRAKATGTHRAWTTTIRN
jgi:outer membrane biosynthesis protein TonB